MVVKRARLVVTGCWAQTDAEAVARVGGVDLVIGNQEKYRLPEVLGRLLSSGSAHAPAGRRAPEVLVAPVSAVSVVGPVSAVSVVEPVSTVSTVEPVSPVSPPPWPGAGRAVKPPAPAGNSINPPATATM